jgi:Icc-related predicted phosphoesterase
MPAVSALNAGNTHNAPKHATIVLNINRFISVDNTAQGIQVHGSVATNTQAQPGEVGKRRNLHHSETWAGNIHPAEALRQYRSEFVGDAKAVVGGMTSNGFTLADPNDRGMLDVVGFDTSAPAASRTLSAAVSQRGRARALARAFPFVLTVDRIDLRSMRLLILSDLHQEFVPFEPVAATADVAVFAGDVHTGKNGLKWILHTYREIPVIYVLGNHEFYGQDIPKLTYELKEMARGTNVHVLENDALEIGDITFLGATLWTDFALAGDITAGVAEAAFQITDYRRIRLSPTFRKLKPQDTRAFHADSVRWLTEQIQNTSGRKLVIVTHHAPSAKSISPKYKNHPVNSSFASNLESLVEATGAALWVHGHIHYASDYLLGSTRVLANPRGYPKEDVDGFNPALTVEV